MSYSFSGNPSSDIIRTTFHLLKKYRTGFLLIALFGRVVNAGVQRYGDNYGDLDTLDNQLATLMEEPAQLFLESMGGTTLQEADALQEKTFLFYQKIRESFKPYIPTFLIMGLSSWLLSTFLSMLVIHNVLYDYKNSKDGSEISESSMWTSSLSQSLKKFIPFFLTNIIVGILTIISLGFLIFPAFILIIYLSFVAHIMLDQNMYFFQAIKESYRLVKGKRWKTFGVGLKTGFLATLLIIFITSFGVYILTHIPNPTLQSALSGILTSIFVVSTQVFMTAFYLRWKLDYEQASHILETS